MEFETVYEGVSNNKPATVSFQSQHVFEQWESGKVDDDLGITIENEGHVHQFWFNEPSSKQQWIYQNLTLVKRN